jgi:vitamin K-dependent gamma-carboxylase
MESIRVSLVAMAVTEIPVRGGPVPAAGASEPRLERALFRPVDISFLVFFRIAFGTVMLWHVWRYASSGAVTYYYVAPRFHFTYFGFDWVQPWPGPGMYLHFLALGVFSLFLLVGLWYRFSAVMVFLGFTYTFLLEKALYQNHYYLTALIALLMIFLPAHRALSLDAARRRELRSDFVPAWALWLVRAQVAIPYFYGGLAKINADWIQGQPMRLGLVERSADPLLGPFFAGQWIDFEWVVAFFVWGGLLFDLLIVPALLWRRTRAAAYFVAVGFHLTNAYMFQIGYFPWFMIAATTVFFEPGWARRLVTRSWPRPFGAAQRVHWEFGPRRRRLILSCLGIYLAVQLLVPLRHYLYPGDVSWTEEGHRFAWHMMLRGKVCGLRILARDPRTGFVGYIDPRDYLNVRQVEKLGKEPDMLVQFSRFVSRDLERNGVPDAEIRFIDLVSLNGRKPQLFVDPTVNLAAERRGWRFYPWILPLTEPLRLEGWDVPGDEWLQHVTVELPDELRPTRGSRPGNSGGTGAAPGREPPGKQMPPADLPPE